MTQCVRTALMRAVSVILIITAGGFSMFALSGCGAKEYKVDYDGEMSWYTGAKETYAAGETVTVYYCLIATDTDYAFYLDGERLNTTYSDDKEGFEISFVMPEHDVKLECRSVNSMVYMPEIEPDTMMVDYCRKTVATVGGDGYTETVLYYVDRYEAKLETYEKYEPDEEETVVTYRVPYEAIERCYDVIAQENLRGWDEIEDKIGLCGAETVCKFREDDGSYVRVSTDDMPQDGEASIDRVGAVMYEYIKDEYRVDSNG
ncbi:MAG: hypothetical protein IKN38_01515 [Clostridia bacterium]|nr:hypothetical protein [Clostridia bacterium]